MKIASLEITPISSNQSFNSIETMKTTQLKSMKTTKRFSLNLTVPGLVAAAFLLCAWPSHVFASLVRTNFNTAGTNTWTCPAGVTSVQVEVWGGGGQGGNAYETHSTTADHGATGGGGGGAYAIANSMPVTPGTGYTIAIAAAPTNSSFSGNAAAGVDTTFTGDGSVIITAGGGQGGTNIEINGNFVLGGGLGGLPSGNYDVGYNGGAGGLPLEVNNSSQSGCGGGGGAGDNGNGGDGSNPTAPTAGPGGTGIIQAGGAGAAGFTGCAYGSPSFNGSNPGGGGGGCAVRGSDGEQEYGSAGGVGMVSLTYNDPNVSTSSNALLTGLALNPAGTLTPTFNSNILTYATSEPAGAMPTVTVTNADWTASNALIVNGSFVASLTSGVASSPLLLPAGQTNTIVVQVTAQDGLTVQTYTVNETQPSAGPYYWDGNDSAAGFGTAGGIWAGPTVGTTTNGWSTDSTGATTVNGNSVITSMGDALNFGTTASGLGAGTITVSGTVNADSLTFGSTNAITFSGGAAAINLAPTATIAFGGNTGYGASFLKTVGAIINGPVLSGANTSLLITNGGCLELRSGAVGWGAGATATISGDSEVYIYSSGGQYGLGGSGGYTVNLGDATTGGSIYSGNSVTIPNNLVVTAGSGFRFISLYDANSRGTSPGYGGNITAHTNLYIIFGSSGSNGKILPVNGTNNTIDSGVTVTYAMGQCAGDEMSDSALWGGSGSVVYTSAALTDVSPAFTNVVASSSANFTISGAKTYSGGATIYGFTNGSYCVVSGSSVGSPVSSGPFGIGTLTLGENAALRAAFSLTLDSTNGNAVVLTGDVTFPTGVTIENSLVFQGNVDLGSTTRTLTCNVGSTTYGKQVDFQGVISGTGSAGLTMAGTGWLELGGTNTYTGNTTVTAGTLEVAVASLANSSTVSVSNGAVLQLDFAETNVVAGLIIDGVSLPTGVYNNANESPFITGSGSLEVVATAGPSGSSTLTNSVTGGGTALSLSWGSGWKLQMQTNSLAVGLGTNWVYLTDGTLTSTNITIDSTKPAVFYRLVYP
jgi:autotransporter-associated beta strand protein